MIAPEQIALRVRDVEPLDPTLKRFTLEAADGASLPSSSAGSHIMLKLDGPERSWKNAYSVVSAPDDRAAYEIVVRRVAQSRGGSAFLHERVGRGDRVHATAPQNLFPLATTGRNHVLIGGGIGLTPLLAHAVSLRRSGARFELHQIGRPEEAAVFERLLAPVSGPGVHVYAGRANCDFEAVLGRQALGSHAYVCGPAELMETVTATAKRLGWPSGAVHHESFGDHSVGSPFRAVLARSGLEIAVGESQSLLEAIEAAGVDAPFLCRGGACGQCMTTVIDGEPEHRDDVLTPEERASGALIMTCVSRSKTPRLVLDL